MNLPACIEEFSNEFSGILTRTTWRHLCCLAVARILSGGITTITQLSILWGYDGYRSPWHRVVGRHKIQLWPLAFRLIELIILRFDLKTVILAVDDTTCLHKGKNVYGRAKHRDGVRSSHSLNIALWGHKWVVVSIVIRLPHSTRQWALPVALGLCRSSDYAKETLCRHKTPAHIARLLIAKIRRKFKKLDLIVVGDQGFGQHETTRWCQTLGITHVSKFYPNAVLHEDVAPSSFGARGRPRCKGGKMLQPKQAVQKTSAYKSDVLWYGGKNRQVELISGVGNWYRIGQPLVKVRWVFVRDLTGTHRSEFFYSNNPALSPETIVSLYTSRWSIETTFQECKNLIRIDKTRVWCEQSTLTLIPFLFGLYSAIILIGSKLPLLDSIQKWPGKKTITFTDMLTDIRKEVWSAQPFLQSLRTTKKFENQHDTEKILIKLLSRAA